MRGVVSRESDVGVPRCGGARRPARHRPIRSPSRPSRSAAGRPRRDCGRWPQAYVKTCGLMLWPVERGTVSRETRRRSAGADGAALPCPTHPVPATTGRRVDRVALRAGQSRWDPGRTGTGSIMCTPADCCRSLSSAAPFHVEHGVLSAGAGAEPIDGAVQSACRKATGAAELAASRGRPAVAGPRAPAPD